MDVKINNPEQIPEQIVRALSLIHISIFNTKTAFQIGGLFLYLCPESLILWAFRAFSVFRGLGGTSRHQPASYCGDHIIPWRLIFAHPCPARICQKRGNAKKYPLPDSTTSFNENNLAGTRCV